MRFIHFYRPQMKFHFIISAILSFLIGYQYALTRGIAFFVAYNLFFLVVGYITFKKYKNRYGGSI
ncbi:hypothetical protein A9165_07700 [Alishewanella sp. HH-ZS]|nr:hypothetical protein A9165_07700 [Alishewanella sp. HH-ZS]